MGLEKNNSGKTIHEIWASDNNTMERSHDFIQWLFPLKDQSMHLKDAPLLDDETIQTFRENLELRDKVLHSLDVFLRFLGLQIEGDKIVRAPLSVVYLDDCLRDLAKGRSAIDKTVLEFWEKAVHE